MVWIEEQKICQRWIYNTEILSWEVYWPIWTREKWLLYILTSLSNKEFYSIISILCNYSSCACLRVCMYIYLYTYIFYICVYINLYVYIYVYIFIVVYIYIHLYVYIHVYMCTNEFMYIHTRICVCVRTNIHMERKRTYTHIYTCSFAYLLSLQHSKNLDRSLTLLIF